MPDPDRLPKHSASIQTDISSFDYLIGQQQATGDVSIGGNLEHSAVVLGDGNTVTYTTNVFGSFEAESSALQPSKH